MDPDAEVIKDLGIFALQALITINAGAIITLLTFIPKVMSLDALGVQFRKIKAALACFLIGLFMSFLSILITYVLSQMQAAGFSMPGFVVFLLLMMVPAVLSFVFFSAGSLVAIRSINEN